MKKISDATYVLLFVSSISVATFIISINQEFYIEFTNCPTETVEKSVGDYARLEFDVQAGNAGVISIFYYFELNGEYYSRLPLDIESHKDFYAFPKSGELTSSATFVEKLAEGDSYLVSIDVLDANYDSRYVECKVDF